MSYMEEIEVVEEELHGHKVTTVHIQSEQAAEKLHRTIGSYITIETGMPLNEHTKIEDAGDCLAEVLGRVMQPYYHGKLCICGIGNQNVPADSLGPEVAYNLPLKFFSKNGTEGMFRDVCSIAPGTSLTNSIDTEVIVGGVVKAIEADCVLLVDSLVAGEPSRLFQTIQIASAGGTRPYRSAQKADWSVLGVPVISLGVPVTIPLSVLTSDQKQSDSMFTSTNIQDVVSAAGRVIAYAILRMCWPSLSKAECFVFSGINRNPLPYSFVVEEENKENVILNMGKECPTPETDKEVDWLY